MKEVADDLVETIHAGMGYRMVSRGSVCLCDDGPDTHSRAAHFAFSAREVTGKRIAWLGAGLCIGPRLFAMMGCTQTVYESEADLSEYCPEGITFVPGDWRQTFDGEADIVILDTGESVTHAELQAIAPGAIILGTEP